MQVDAPDNGKTLVAAAEIPRSELRAESLVNLGEHGSVPGFAGFIAYVPKSQINVKVGASGVCHLAEIKDILKVSHRIVLR